VRGLLFVDPLGAVGDCGSGRFSEEMLARTPDEARQRADELDQRAMAGLGTEADAVESLPVRMATYPGPVEVRYGLGSPSRRRAPSRGRRHSPPGTRPGCRKRDTSRGWSSRAARPTGCTGWPSGSQSLDVKNLDDAYPEGVRDEVDELSEAWARERPDLDLRPVAVFSRISRLARHLDLARREAFTAHAIEPWEFDVLAALRRAGAPYELSPGRLLRATLVTSGTMTNRIDRLAERGLVERHPDPDDRRGVIVRLTAEGKAAVDGAFTALVEAEAVFLGELPPAQQKELAGLLRQLLIPFGS
jgi:DNA-binding MarR family transcriptional regulator